MEIPGDFFKPYIGLVHQQTYAPVGPLIPFKMSRTTLDPESDGVNTAHNAVPGYKTGISAKRGTSGKVEQLCWDPAFNIYGITPFGLAASVWFHEGVFIRMLCSPDTSIPNAGVLALPGEQVAPPITGLLAVDRLAAAPIFCYIFLSIRIKKIHHMADAAAGQPFDFDFETVYPYTVPGEDSTVIELLGFNSVQNSGSNGGFY